MASIWKDKRSRFWVACFTDRDGRRVKKSTKETDSKKAQKIADGYEIIARKKQTLRTVRATITALSRELWDVQVISPSIREHVEAWLEEKRASSAVSTIEFYEKSTEKFLNFLGSGANDPIEHIERTHVAKFKIEIAKTLAPKTVNHHLKLLRMVFKAARRDGLIDEDPAEFVDAIRRKEKRVRRAFTKEELQQVLDACDEEWRSMVMFGLYTGQRLADIANLRWANVDLAKNEVRIITRKTAREMTIPMAPALLRHVKTLLARDKGDADDYVEQPTHHAARPIHPRAAGILQKLGRVGSLSNQFSAILVEAGLRDAAALLKQSNGKGRQAKRIVNELSFHSLRHTAVSLLKDAGIPAAVVMELVGHDSEQVSQQYTHVGRDALKKAAKAMPNLL